MLLSMTAKEKRREYNQKGYAANREHELEKKRKEYAANPALFRGKVSRRRAENRELYRERNRRWNAENVEWHRESSRRYFAEHPERLSAIHHNRRARLKGNGGKCTAAEEAAVYARFGHRCLCCGLGIEQLRTLDRTLVLDHVVPLAKGGRNDASNLQPLCHTLKGGLAGGCNNHKRDKHIDYR